MSFLIPCPCYSPSFRMDSSDPNPNKDSNSSENSDSNKSNADDDPQAATPDDTNPDDAHETSNDTNGDSNPTNVPEPAPPPPATTTSIPTDDEDLFMKPSPTKEHQAALDADYEKTDESGRSGESDRSADEGTSDAASNSSSGSQKSKKTNRCLVCRKKVGLTGFVCRCGGLFCSVHRYSDKHDCTFNYRELGAEEIRKNNPVVLSEKIHKI